VNLILCGLQGSGKTSVGLEAARALGMHFLDTDRMIEESEGGKSCRQLYTLLGKARFRALECAQIARLEKLDGALIAIGGGAIEYAQSRRILQRVGFIIYLQAPEELLWQRISMRGIPAYLNPLDPQGSFLVLAKKRALLYEQCADMTIATGFLTIADVVDVIMKVTDGKQWMGHSLQNHHVGGISR